MSTICQYLFFLSLFMIFYVYLGYPVLVYLISKIKMQSVQKADFLPGVTIIIAAYNEEDCIASTLENKTHLDYPKDKLEIIVVSDGSTDRTDAIVDRYKKFGVRLLRQEPRAGKTSAINMAVGEAAGDILVSSDANSIYAPDALKRLMQNFNDSSVGYVTGKMIYTNPDGSAVGDGCTTYMKYENLLRDLETRVGSVVGVDGGIDAVRKELYKPMRPDQLPDFVLPLMVVEQRYRVVYEPNALLREPILNAAHDEYRMRVRVALRALWAIWDMRHLLSLRRYGLYAWQLWSHKVLRYGCFLFLIAAYGSNLLLLREHFIYSLTFILQNLAYMAALLSPFLEKRGYKTPIVNLFHYFALLNIACAHAFFKFLFRQKQLVWTPRKG